MKLRLNVKKKQGYVGGKGRVCGPGKVETNAEKMKAVMSSVFRYLGRYLGRLFQWGGRRQNYVKLRVGEELNTFFSLMNHLLPYHLCKLKFTLGTLNVCIRIFFLVF